MNRFGSARLMTGMLLIALVAAGCLTANAAQYEDYRGYRIHYTTFSSMIIPPEVAAMHNIVRAENRVVLNVSVRQGDAPTPADVQGSVTNLLNQRFELEFQEVREQDAVYYLATHLADDDDILRFELNVAPESTGEPLRIAFLRRYD